MKKQFRLGFISQSQAVNEMRSPIWHQQIGQGDLKHPLINAFFLNKTSGCTPSKTQQTII